jgi:phosphatidate cytidylyltransferase
LIVGLIALLVLYAGRSGILCVVTLVCLQGGREAFRLFKRFPMSFFSAFIATVVLLLPVFLGLFWHVVHFQEQEFFEGQMMLLFLIGSKSQDIFAYFTGYFFGKTPLIPSISPKKTREGALGGILGSGGMLCFFSFIWKINIPINAVAYGVMLGMGSLAGDLLESKIKRRASVKDSAALLPGFGGVLDMIDSLILAAPVSYLWWTFLT